MSEIEALLDEYSGAGSGVNEEHIVIGRDRYITVPESLKKLGVQYDHNVETLIFDCPRYWDDVDLSTLSVYITYMRTDGVPGSYSSQKVTVDENDDTLMHFEWTITKSATLAAGPIVFLVCIKSIDEEGNETVHWNSELNEDTYISEGLEVNSTIEQMFPDVITQLVTRMNTIENKFDPSNVVAMENLLNGIKDGTTVVGKATSDGNGNVISETYETKANAAATYATKEEVVSVTSGQMQGEINKIKDGTTVVGKATSDGNGNVISDTYATKEEVQSVTGGALQEAITKIVDGTTTVGKATADAAGNDIQATYATKEEVTSTTDGQLRVSIDNIVNGTTPAGKAVADAEGNSIKDTYAKSADVAATYATKDEVQSVTGGALQEEITKIKDGTTVVGKSTEAVSAKGLTGSVNGETHPVEFVTKEEYTSLEAAGTLVGDTIYVIKDDGVIDGILDGTVPVGKARDVEQLYLHTVTFKIFTDMPDATGVKFAEFSVTYTDTNSEVYPHKTTLINKWIFLGEKTFNVPIHFWDWGDNRDGHWWYQKIEFVNPDAESTKMRLYSRVYTNVDTYEEFDVEAVDCWESVTPIPKV